MELARRRACWRTARVSFGNARKVSGLYDGAHRRDRAPASPMRDLILSAISSNSRRADGSKAPSVSMATIFIYLYNLYLI